MRRIPQWGGVLFILELSDLGNQTNPSKGECFMKMPSAISTWCMILFFLLAGLTAFGVSVPMAGTLTGIFALGAAVFLFLGR
jgi:hypothetical protein